MVKPLQLYTISREKLYGILLVVFPLFLIVFIPRPAIAGAQFIIFPIIVFISAVVLLSPSNLRAKLLNLDQLGNILFILLSLMVIVSISQTVNGMEIAREVIPHFDKIFCVSQRLADEAIELGANSDNVVLAPNIVNTEKFRPLNKDECRDKLGLPKDEFIVIFVGHYIERKGPLRVLNAINSLNGNVKGVFLGKGKQQPVGENVLFADSVPNDELPTWLNAADVFVLPTLAEGYCNAINEAMACGLPIITSDIEDVKAQVPDHTGILVNPNSSGEISEAIERMYFDNATRKLLGQSARNLALERFRESRAKKILVQINFEYANNEISFGE